MNIQEILSMVKEHGAEEVKSILEEISRENAALTHEAKVAFDAYFADVKHREDKIKQQVESISCELDTLSERILAIRPSLVAATIEGDVDKVDKIQKEIADMEAKKATLVTQIDLLSGAHVPGNKELFREADEKLSEVSDDGFRLRELKKMVHEFSGEQAKLWERLENYTNHYERAGGKVFNSNRLYEHFRQQ